MSDAMSIAPGTRLHHYEIAACLGAGGMGEVYRALDLHLGRTVAIKILSPSLLPDRGAVERMRREARAASALHHPGIVTIYAVGDAEGAPFIVMEYVEGESLREILERGPMPLPTLLDLGVQLADAIEAAHAGGILHRDIKPSNILVTRAGRAKLLDFGLAKRCAAPAGGPGAGAPEAGASPATTELTLPGTVLGTLAYMSPEQARGEPVDPRSDLFSLGCVLYEMAAGRPAFPGASTLEVLDAIATRDPVPPSAVRAGVPYEVDLLIARALEKERGRRFASAGELKEALRASIGARPAEPPGAPRPPAAARPNNLPAETTSFVGRSREVAEVKRLVLKHRLVTIAGAGGCGKTRLALQAARQLLPEFPDGAWIVELAGLSDPALLPRAAAAALGLREEPGRPVLETLLAHARPRSLLLVLDNGEHLAEACAALARECLAECPGCRILVTSRAVLGAPGEVRWRIPSLSAPPEAGVSTREEALQYESVRLFVDRASAVRPSFALGDGNAAAVARICATLDGIPLAIELAAARVNVLPVPQILARLTDRFALLTSGSRAGSARHRTLRAALDWSHDLLSEEERALFRRLSVFAGGLPLEAAEEVCAGGGVEPGRLLDLLSDLADKSLIVPEEGAGGAARYRLLESMRQYGRERLRERGEEDSVLDRHAAHFTALVERAEPELEGPEQVLWVERLEEERDNLRLAIQRALAAGDAARALRLVAGLWRFWWIRGYLTEGRDRVRAVLEAAGAGGDPPVLARAYLGAGRLHHELGDYAAARAHHERALEIRRSLGDRSGVAMSLVNLGIVAHGQGDRELARARYRESLAIQEELQSRRGVAICLNNLGRLAAEQGQLEEAGDCFGRSLEIRQALGDLRGMSISLDGLGDVAFQRGDLEGSRSFYERSLANQRELGDRQGTAESLLRLATIAATLARGEEARARMREAVRISGEVNDRLRLADALDTAALLASVEGEAERALRYIGAGESFRAAGGFPRTPADEARMRALLERMVAGPGARSGTALAAALAAGRALEPGAALAELASWLAEGAVV